MLNGLKVETARQARHVVKILCKLLTECQDGTDSSLSQMEDVGRILEWDGDDLLMVEQDLDVLSSRAEILRNTLERLLQTKQQRRDGEQG